MFPTTPGAQWWNERRAIAASAPGDILGCGTVGGGSIGEAIRKGYEARFTPTRRCG